jgi:hypothetical protein
MRLEALHEAFLALRRRACRPAGHLQRRGGGRVATPARRTANELGLPTESDRTRHLILRRFQKVEPWCVRGEFRE